MRSIVRAAGGGGGPRPNLHQIPPYQLYRHIHYKYAELGMQHCVSFATTTTPQRYRASKTRNNSKNVKVSVSNGVATANIVIMQ